MNWVMGTDEKHYIKPIAKDKKNASVKGIVAKIGTAIEEFFLDEANINAMSMMSQYDGITVGSRLESSYYWSLNQYRTNVRKAQKAEDWDELEKSVIASIADDIIVGVKGLQADITIIKKFA
mgnify:CR=1 FL=1